MRHHDRASYIFNCHMPWFCFNLYSAFLFHLRLSMFQNELFLNKYFRGVYWKCKNSKCKAKTIFSSKIGINSYLGHHFQCLNDWDNRCGFLLMTYSVSMWLIKMGRVFWDLRRTISSLLSNSNIDDHKTFIN